MSVLGHKVYPMKETIQTHTPKRFNEAVLLHTAETGSPEWAEWREQGLGGSDIGAILGLNEYKSAYALWAERTGKIDVEPVDNWSVRFGKAFELPILELWGEQNPDWTIYLTGTYCDKTYPFLQASPDALAQHKTTGEWILLEVKTARYNWDSLPPSYEAQVVHYLDVMGITRGRVIAVAGWNWFEQEIIYDEFQAEAQRQAAIRFWSLIQADREPDFDGATSTYEAVRKMNPDIDPELSVELPEADQLLLAQQNYDNAQKELNLAKSRALSVMGKAKSAYSKQGDKFVTVATRQARGDGAPYLIIKKGSK